MKKCGRCTKPAVLHITEIRHGEVQALHLCESCAKEYLSQSPDDQSESDEGESSSESQSSLEEIDQQACPNCGITFKEFRAGGRLGCPHDYTVFETELLPLLENIHGETEHCGKVPKRAPDASQRQIKLLKLRSELRTAVEEERYEAAAKLRDEIQNLSEDKSTQDHDLST